MHERWDLPQTEEGLQTLLARLEESRAAGDERAVGWGMLALAGMVVWVRSDNDLPPFVRADQLYDAAIGLFRRVGDERGLLRALRSPSMLRSPEETDERLREAMEIAEHLGDGRAVAHTVAARARAMGMRDPDLAIQLHREALERYRTLEDKTGQADSLFGLAIADGDSRLKYERALEAAHLYREAGNPKMAAQMASIALMNGESFMSQTDLEPIALRGLADAQSADNRSTEALMCGSLAKIATAKGEAERAATFRRWQQELAEADGLTPKERWRDNLAITRQLVQFAKASKNREAVKLFEEELQKLKKSVPK